LSLDDVGDASYAAVPELVRIHRSGGAVYWNLYAMVAIIELARSESQNLEVPDWLREDYFRSIQELAQMGTEDISLPRNRRPNEPSSALLPLQEVFGLTEFLVEYSEDELLEMEP